MCVSLFAFFFPIHHWFPSGSLPPPPRPPRPSLSLSLSLPVVYLAGVSPQRRDLFTFLSAPTPWVQKGGGRKTKRGENLKFVRTYTRCHCSTMYPSPFHGERNRKELAQDNKLTKKVVDIPDGKSRTLHMRHFFFLVKNFDCLAKSTKTRMVKKKTTMKGESSFLPCV